MKASLITNLSCLIMKGLAGTKVFSLIFRDRPCDLHLMNILDRGEAEAACVLFLNSRNLMCYPCG